MAVYPEKPVLIVDDEDPILLSYEVALSRGGINNVVQCKDSRDVEKIIEEKGSDLVLLDLNMPFLSGTELLENLVSNHPDLPVIIITGNDDIESAVNSIKSGAYNYLVKPVSRERLLTTVKHALSVKDLQRENSILKQSLLGETVQNPEHFAEIITDSPHILQIFTYIEAIAQTNHCVLLTGETGSGKELFANAIHNASGRKGEFVAVNVAGFDDNMFADALFGHVKGAFTGADMNRPGIIEKAEGGTLLLDEIGDLSSQSQVKLLRLLQEKEYTPIGSDTPCKPNTRVICATNADLTALQQSGAFRPDLYFRLYTHHISLPPLRERLEDLPVLVDHFLETASKAQNKKKPTHPKELVSLLSTYTFPGNIRELEAIVTDAVSRHKSKMLSLDVFREYINSNRPAAAGTTVQSSDEDAPSVTFGPSLPPIKEIKKLLINEALRRTDGNRTRAAELLGTTRQALSWHLKEK